MDTAQWPQEMTVKPMEEMMVANTCSSSSVTTGCPNVMSNHNGKACSTALERKVRPEKDQALNCPRCNSTNTKFCYYNNYSLTQPRYFCKTCRRYWTEGGSLRNIPVGGGSRKNNKRSSSSSSSSSPSSSSPASKKLSHDHMVAAETQSHHHHHHHHHLMSPTNPKNSIHHQGQDLNLGFPPTHQEFRSLSEFIQLPNLETNPTKTTQIPHSAAPTSGANHHHLSALELLNGLTSSRGAGLTPFMPMPPVPDPNAVYSSSGLISLHDFKPSLSFSLDAIGNGYGTLSGGVQPQETTNNGRLFFPFEDSSKPVSSNTSADHDNTNNNNNNNNNNTDPNDQTRDQGDSTGYWSGMLGTGGSW